MNYKWTGLALMCCFYYSLLYSQNRKPTITADVPGTWPVLDGNITISKDGRYTAYIIGNLPIGAKTLLVQDVSGNWQKHFVSEKIENEFYFSRDSRMLCFKSGDTLQLQNTGSDQITKLILDLYKYSRYNKGEWLAYRQKASDKLVLLNLVTNKRNVYTYVEDALFDDNGSCLLLNCKDDQGVRLLKRVDMRTHKSSIIWKGDSKAQFKGYQFDKEGNQIAFLVNDSMQSKVYYYKTGMQHAVERLSNASPILDGKLEISRVTGFSDNGKWLFIKLARQKVVNPKPKADMVSVDIWSFRDELVNPHQAITPDRNPPVDMVVNVEDAGGGILLNPDRVVTNLSPGGTGYVKGDHWILSSDTSEGREYWWPHNPEPESWVVSLANGSREKIPLHEQRMKFSPSGKWIIIWAKKNDRYDYYSYETLTGKLINITDKLPVSVAMENIVNLDSSAVGIAGWIKNDDAVLIYDNYDIWKIDLSGIKAPVNITNRFGAIQRIKLRLINDEKETIYQGNEIVLLSGYNEESKSNGFLSLDLKGSSDPKILTMNAFSWYRKKSQVGNSAETANLLIAPVEGGNGKNKGWVLMGESATEYSNYYYTKDLKFFRRLSNLAPQKNYNWFTTELISWKMFNGKTAQGILYKPEDFDSTKKYPVIFNYYERSSGWLYSFQQPQLTKGKINIPWFVSRGYLVFTPDIYFSPAGKSGITSGEHAYNSVVSAAEHLTSRPYIDKERIGIQGHSFGGFLTAYLLTHASFFAAAAEGAGFTDEMSNYLSLMGVNLIYPLDRTSTQSLRELHHGLFGGPPWQYPALYLKSSPVWDADKASAPLLIHHNKKDEQVPWRQGVEMYMALRRLGKPCWMLQYDNGGHGAGEGSKDFTIRLTQYFDHYLKKAPAPYWMTQGIPANLKQVVTGYELDPDGNCSKDCKVCEKWNHKMKRDALSTMKEIQGMLYPHN